VTDEPVGHDDDRKAPAPPVLQMIGGPDALMCEGDACILPAGPPSD
jgi:hypothetical protein